ncbi:LysR substrate-binding domain-containing protein [Cohaesibacter celericrescens]|uniref:LysR family transcriptional regulator n=1 Tax=Cohaesibacter celericrescens TaxID=2067669 RepID=A0A2N5XLJ0_9HYPH|nr:LysR substrate-binding domain-containing protein [Cohaesibacter celericrescens]PLW75389.1 LysR family transcriptional regulator [Cohaesibacter celericrescens]
MRLRQIEAFRATMNTGTITGAAHMMSVTQPSVSRLIADLEENLGFRLFDRKSSRLQPTEEASRFYQEVERTFAGIDQLEHVAERIRQEQMGLLNVFSTPALSASLLPSIVKKFHETHPKTEVRLDVRVPMEIFRQLQANTGDVAISNHAAELPGVVQEPLINAVFICALPEGHRLAAKEVITPQDLEGETIIGLSSEGPLNWNKIFKTFEDKGVMYHKWLTTQHAETGYAMVAEGIGIGILEPFSARRWSKIGVVIRPLRPKFDFAFSICFSANKARSSIAQDFAQIVREQLKNDPLPFQC